MMHRHRYAPFITVLILATVMLAGPVSADYRATVPCFDATIQSKYHTACTVTNSLGASDAWRYGPSALFTCDGNVPGIYWNTLSGLGIATCVCGFIGSAGNPWVYQIEYGKCNGACTAASYTCDGTNPVVNAQLSTTPTTTPPGPTPTRPVSSSLVGAGAKSPNIQGGFMVPLIMAFGLY